MASDGEFLRKIIIESLISHGGAATMLNVSKWIWENHRIELEDRGNLFFRWQYEMRWAATSLRKDGILLPSELSDKGIWVLDDNFIH